MENAIEVKNISKKFRIYHENRNSVYESLIGFFSKKKFYEELLVLDDISFSVKKGEIFGIMGRNGVGKSTLLRIISGIYKADKGSVEINGKISTLLGLGAGFEIDLTARDNVLRYGMMLGMEKKEIKEKIDKIIEFAGVVKFADIKLKNFSSGMYQRLAFSTMAHMDPDIMMIDEAIFAGDIGFQQKCFDTIIKFKQKNKSVLLVSHNMEPMQTMCDRAMLLNNKKIQIIGKPFDVITQFRELFTKEIHD